jgi:CheY-like chemotaxis protein/two-component sensor histidine kinase
VGAAIHALRPTAEAKEIEFKMDFDSEICLVKGDPTRLRQVVWNLLMNAIKFTPSGGTITVCLEGALSTRPAAVGDTGLRGEAEIRNPKSDIRNSNYARLTVTDTGEGITESFLPFVFDRFRQAEGSISRKQGGLGLGLAVARHLVELHGGAIKAESAGPQQGSTFTVDLPLAGERRDPGRQQERQREIERRNTVVAVRKLDDINVLLVEDDEDSRNLFGVMLMHQGAEVTSTSSATEALAALELAAHQQNLPDVIVSDVGMAEQDGYELMRKVRALTAEQGGLTPALALTGYATRRDRERAFSAGFQLHLAKPVEPAELVAAIASLIPRKV